ncbi:MAG: hypothetical protein ACRESR_06585 [Gammaproteobacteria bacterium]
MKRTITAFMLAGALALPLAMLPAHSASAGVRIGISVGFGPPPLPWYPQPICPGYGYYWVPGYWAWGPPYGYFWVPGAWVWPPVIGFVWTPGFWGWRGGYWRWHRGYWGRHVGFYGDIAYGHGYNGHGYHGGYWRNGHFHYNRAVTNLAPSLLHGRNVYNRPVAHPAHHGQRVSYNGGENGINLQPTAHQRRELHAHHFAPTHIQTLNLADARQNPAMRLANNHGRPVLAIHKPIGPSITPRDSNSTNLAPEHNKRAHHPVFNDPGARRINRLGSRHERPSPSKPNPPAVRIDSPPVLIAKPRPIEPRPIHRPDRNPRITPRLRPHLPPVHRPTDTPVLNARPRPMHPARPDPVIRPRRRPVDPFIRSRPQPTRPNLDPRHTPRPMPIRPMHRPSRPMPMEMHRSEPRPIHSAAHRARRIAPRSHHRSVAPRHHPVRPPNGHGGR